MHKHKAWKCSACGAEVPDLPMSVLKHLLAHVERRPLALGRLGADALREDQPQQP